MLSGIFLKSLIFGRYIGSRKKIVESCDEQIWIVIFDRHAHQLGSGFSCRCL